MKTMRRIRIWELEGSQPMRCLLRSLEMDDADQDVMRSSPRRGAVMVFALIGLLVTSMMIGALLKTTGMSHRQLKRDEFRLQAGYLADAGCERARLMLQSQPDLKSDEWQVPAGELSQGRTATVTISVEKKEDHPSRFVITATAVYPLDHPDLVRVTHQLPVQ